MQHPARNALGTDLLDWLDGELTRADGEPILLTGTGDAFCAGLNLKEVVAKDPAEMPAFLDKVDAFATRLFHYPAPTVAWINGHAIAGGCVLALCCDYRVLTRNRKTLMGVNEVALGACYPPRIMRIVKERLSPAHAHEVMLGAGLYGPQDALRLGLVDEVSEVAEGSARRWLGTMAGHPRDAYRLIKAELISGVTEVSESELRIFRDQQGPLWSSDGMRARMRTVLGG